MVPTVHSIWLPNKRLMRTGGNERWLWKVAKATASACHLLLSCRNLAARSSLHPLYFTSHHPALLTSLLFLLSPAQLPHPPLYPKARFLLSLHIDGWWQHPVPHPYGPFKAPQHWRMQNPAVFMARSEELYTTCMSPAVAHTLPVVTTALCKTPSHKGP